MRQAELHTRFGDSFAYPGLSGSDEGFVFLADRSKEDWSRLLAHAEALRFRAGDVVIREGDDDRALSIVVDGTLEILLRDARGASYRYGLIEARSVTGEIAFLDGRPRTATIRAVSAGNLLRLGFESYEVLAARHPDLGRAILLDLGRILAARLRQTNEALARASN